MKSFLPLNGEEKEFCRHISDLITLGEKTFSPRFSAFLTEREQHLAETVAASVGVDYCFWGGHDDAVRKIFASPYAENDDFPLQAVTFTFRSKDRLSHRDFLGALMSLGIKRDQIGDIAVSEGAAVVFATRTVASLLLNEIDKVGRVGVKTAQGITVPLPEQQYDELSLVTASFRIDAVVASVSNLSREKSAALIKQGGVIINGAECCSVSENLDTGDIFSVKGYGKFIFSDTLGVTKKGKNHIIVKKYK